jgi:hypothetical protein
MPSRRARDQAALRREVADVLGSEPRDPFVDLSDCQHGCNGACLMSGSDRCDFTCHPDAPTAAPPLERERRACLPGMTTTTESRRP